MPLSALSKYKNAALLIMRAGIGIAMTLHGYPKISGGQHAWLEAGKTMHVYGVYFFPLVWGFLAAIIEFLGGILILLGLAFRPACILLALLMLTVLLNQIRLHVPYLEDLHPLEHLVVFAGLLLLGPGRFSADGK